MAPSSAPQPEPTVDAAQVVAIVEEIMTQHWDRRACPCWVCTAGRRAGCTARGRYLPHNDPGNHHGRVWVDPAVHLPTRRP